MSLASGNLRHRVDIQEFKFLSQDPVTGEETRGWSSVRECWASISPLSGRDLIAAQAAQSKVSARIVIRYAEGIEPYMRVVHKKRGNPIVYEINAILEDTDSGIEYLTLLVSRGVSIDGR